MTDNLENPFWHYSLAHYARPEVAACCLDYQDRFGANINLLLFCCWLGSNGVQLEAETLEQAELTIDDWDNQVVQPLRAVRRYVKSSAAPLDAVIDRLQALELMAEQVVQATLFEWWLEGGELQATNAGTDMVSQRLNLNAYFALLGCESTTKESPLLWPVGHSLAVD